jgi:hypothetical protein
VITDRIKPLPRPERGRALTGAFRDWVAAGKRVHASLQAGTDVNPEDLWTELSSAESLAVQLTSHRWGVVAGLLLSGASWPDVCDELPMTRAQAGAEFGSWLDTRAEFLECGMYLGLSRADIRNLSKTIEETEQ